MKQTIYGVIGYKGKLGSLLVGRPNFVPIDCDITNLVSVQRAYRDVDVIVNCAALSSIEECEAFDRQAFNTNARGVDRIHQVFGKRVLTISSDHVFGNGYWWKPTEKTKPSPINVYGTTKMIAEDLAVNTYGGKILRLSRVVDTSDSDISNYLSAVRDGEPVKVPTFIRRNYLTRSQAVDGIEYHVRRFDYMPPIVNYGNRETTSAYNLTSLLVEELGLPAYLVQKNDKYSSKLAPRPQTGGFSVKLANRLGFPKYSVKDTVHALVEKR